MELSLVIKTITGIAGVIANPLKNKLERNTEVIKILKNLGFELDHPPTDFSGVYAYSLVEYGVGLSTGQKLEKYTGKGFDRS